MIKILLTIIIILILIILIIKFLLMLSNNGSIKDAIINFKDDRKIKEEDQKYINELLNDKLPKISNENRKKIDLASKRELKKERHALIDNATYYLYTDLDYTKSLLSIVKYIDSKDLK